MIGAAESRPSVPGVDLAEAIVRTNLSEVWKGVRRSDGAAVAVKFATPACGPETLRQEGRTVEALRAAGVGGIVPAVYGEEPVPHLVMPWKGVRTFRDVLSGIGGGDDRSRAMETFFGLVETVAKVHREGFLHGDLKPENVIVDEEGRPWLTDFGMARTIRAARLDTHVSLSMSKSEVGWGGTLNYLPPEGIQGEPPAPSWDVYALGVILHEILLGGRPDRASTPEHLRALLPGEVVEVLLVALAYAPADRLATVPLLLVRLKRIRASLTARGLSRWLRRGSRLGLAGLAAFFVALRYGTLVALLAAYAAIAIGAFLHPLILLVYLPFLLLHIMIRWEGPETAEELSLRQSGRTSWRN